MSVQLRPETAAGQSPDDEAFLRRLVTETIALELGADGWPEPVSAFRGTSFRSAASNGRSRGE